MSDGDAPGELAEIRRELRRVRWWIEDAELRGEISDWIEESHNREDADTAREYVETRLNRLLANNEMYNAPDSPRPEDAFADGCIELACKHVGGACPVLLDEIEVRWRERKLAEAETERAARRVYERQATDVGCPRIPKLLEEWDDTHGDFIRRGNRLLQRAEDQFSEEDALDADTDGFDEFAAAVPDGGDDPTDGGES